MKKALITGIAGQDGSYLAELLLDKGYHVLGLVRHSSSARLNRLEPILQHPSLQIVEGDLLDPFSLKGILQNFLPDEIYNLAAMSHVKSSFSLPEYTMEVNGLAVLRLLELVRQVVPTARIYQASTSELFGKTVTAFQNETSPFYPRSPYAIAKLCAFWAVKNYREAYGLYACNGILFNHESPRRGEEFVSRKVSIAVSRIVEKKQEKLLLGNLDAKRDWGYAQEFVYGMWQMLQQEVADDFVLATGKAHSVREFVETAFAQEGIALYWEGSGVDEKGKDVATGKTLVEVDPKLFRPAEVDFLLGDPSKAKQQLGWEAKMSFAQLVSLMVAKDKEACL